LKTCPACQRAVPDDAATCPQPDCGHSLAASRAIIKRLPPLTSHVHVAGNDAHPATPRPIEPRPALGAKSSTALLIVGLFAMLVGSGIVAAGLLGYVPRTADKKAVAESGDNKTNPVQQPVKSSQKDGNAAHGAEPAPASQAPPSKPDEPVEIVTNQHKSMADKEPTGVLADVPPKPEPLAVPKEPLSVSKEPLGVPKPLAVAEEPKLAVVADSPQGLYGERTKPKTPDWLAQRGGTVESQKAVEDGLNWLARHQGPDGHWGADCLGTAHNSRCEKKAPCEGTGEAYEAAQTGMALLALQAAGHYYFNGQKHSGQVAKGLDCLVQGQAPDGSIIGSQNPSPAQINAGAAFNQYFMYEHAMATFALCEACAVAVAEGKTPDPRYLEAAQHAVSFIEKIQHDDGGWRYTVNAGERSDCSVSGWVMLALKSAREANLSVSPETISRMMYFFAAHYEDGRTYYLGQSGNFVQFSPFSTDTITGVGMMAIEFFQHSLDSPVVERGAAYLADRAEAKDGIFPLGGYYLWYNCTMAMFQVGGDPWKRWNRALRDPLIALQVQGEGCDRGSWPPSDPWGIKGGRIYSTALAVLTLEVYYRFQRIAGQPEKAEFFEK
jgi:hypothetical protein